MKQVMKDEYLFVYGTLRRKAGSKLFSTLDRFSKFVGEATYQGRLYRISHYPGVVPSDDPADQVQGEVYLLRNSFVVLSRLDRYEGCGPGFTNPTEYVRTNHDVRLATGEDLSAWVYVYNRSITGLDQLPDGEFNNVSGAPKVQ